MNRATFFSCVRGSLFHGVLSQPQVVGMTTILDSFADIEDLRFTAYALATAYHETAQAMEPVREGGRGQGMAYGTIYYGRGLVQLTWESNYAKFSKLLGVDLVAQPDRALEPVLASKIMHVGMIEGIFTTRKLSDYFSPTIDDPVNARRIINGMDRAAQIAVYHGKFLAALKAAFLTQQKEISA